MYKNWSLTLLIATLQFVSILVLMDLCIKTDNDPMCENFQEGFNPCFNGSMYKNIKKNRNGKLGSIVSILVLMELCIKTLFNQL